MDIQEKIRQAKEIISSGGGCPMLAATDCKLCAFWVGNWCFNEEDLLLRTKAFLFDNCIDTEETVDFSTKKVLKLDKNFHVYLHCQPNKIFQGADEKGKYLKLYYESIK